MAYVHDFHVQAEAVTIKGTLLLKDGTTVEADKLQGIGELDVDDQKKTPEWPESGFPDKRAGRDGCRRAPWGSCL